MQTIFIDLDPYLRDWFMHYCGVETLPVRLPKGCIEGKVLHMSLRAPRANEHPVVLCPPGWTPIVVPSFRGLNPDSDNFLPESGRTALKSVIRDRFDVDLWMSIGDAPLRKDTLKDLVFAWMDARRIEITDTNFETVMARYKALRDRNGGAIRQKRFRESKKNKEITAAKTEV